MAPISRQADSAPSRIKLIMINWDSWKPHQRAKIRVCVRALSLLPSLSDFLSPFLKDLLPCNIQGQEIEAEGLQI